MCALCGSTSEYKYICFKSFREYNGPAYSTPTYWKGYQTKSDFQEVMELGAVELICLVLNDMSHIF